MVLDFLEEPLDGELGIGILPNNLDSIPPRWNPERTC